MIFTYPWFTARRLDMEQIGYPGHGEWFLRLRGIPARFVRIDRRLIDDNVNKYDLEVPEGLAAGSRIEIVGTPYIVLRRDANTVTFSCVRADFPGKFILWFDKVYHAIAMREAACLWWLHDHHLLNVDMNESVEWKQLFRKPPRR